MSERRSKYGNKKTEVDGFIFDSKREAHYYAELKLREKAGEIFDLELQPKFPCEVNGKLICTYIADFRYRERRSADIIPGATITGDVKIIVDVKGAKTDVYKIKKKLVEALYGVEIVEV